MTTLLDPRSRIDVTDNPDATTPQGCGRRRAGERLREQLARRGRSLAWLLPLLAVTAAARLVNLGGTPQRIDDEGTYTAQAFAVERLGELGHYTYWYDHPPLGWIQIAAWTAATGGFDRHDIAVLAAREAMVVAAVASAALLWLLGRRLGLTRPAAATAVLLFALSPLAVQFTKTAYLDNIATPWLLAAFVLALSRRNQLLAFTGAATCFGIAVLTKETSLLLLPFLVWQLVRSADAATRRYTLSVAAALLTMIGLWYAVFALIKGELTPGEERVSLFDGIAFQLVTRDASGSVLDAGSQAGLAVRTWLTLDAALLVTGLVAALAALTVHALRPYAAAYVLLALTLFKPGYLPVPFVIAMLPFAALLVAALGHSAVRLLRDRDVTRRGRAGGAVGAVVLIVGIVAAAALWPGQLRGLWTSDLDAPLRDAQGWVVTNLEEDDRILVDDAVWVDLVRGGLPREQVVWYYKADTDPDVSDLTPNGWADYDYVLVTEGMRQSAGSAPVLDRARESSIRVASFGEGAEAVEILRVLPAGTDDYYSRAYGDEQARSAAAALLADNPSLRLTPDARTELVDARVDARVIAVLAQLAGEHELSVSGFPVEPGERDSELPTRSVALDEIDGEPITTGGDGLDAVIAEARSQSGAYATQSVGREGDELVLRFPIAEPADLLPAPPGS